MPDTVLDDGLASLVRALRQHGGKALIAFVVISGATVVGLKSRPRPYQAEASLLITYGREFVYRPELGEGGSPNNFRLEEILNSEVEILRSRDLARSVIDQVGLDELYPDLVALGLPEAETRERAVGRLRQAMKVQAVRKSNVIRLSLLHANPKVAASTLQVLLESFKDKHIEVFSDSKSDFLAAQLDDYRKALRESEDRLELFVKEHGLHDVPEQRRLRLSQLLELDSARMAADVRITDLEEELAVTDRPSDTDAAVHPDVATDRAVQEARSRLLELQLQEQELLRQHADGSRAVVTIRREIDIVRRALERREREAGDARRVAVEDELAVAVARRDRLGEQVADVERELHSLNEHEKELRRLRREVAANEQYHATYLAKYEDARITEDLDRRRMVNIKVIQGAAVPVEPTGPSLKLILLVGLLAGLAGGLGVALAADLWAVHVRDAPA